MRWTFALFFVSIIQLILADGCEDAKPEFSAPGQRISEQKCREYNWQRKQIDQCSNVTANTEYPYMGFLGYKRGVKLTFLCGGFLISPKFLVTSADCITVPTTKGFWKVEVVRLGIKNLDDNEPHVDVEVHQTIANEVALEDDDESEYITGLVELKSEVPFTKSVHPGCLWMQPIVDMVRNKFSPGWPKTGKDSKKGNVRSEVQINVMKRGICMEHLNFIFQLKDHHICASESIFTTPDYNSEPTGTGVMVTQFNLDGKAENRMPFVLAVASSGVQSDLDVSIEIGIYSKIYSSLDWIEEKVWN